MRGDPKPPARLVSHSLPSAMMTSFTLNLSNVLFTIGKKENKSTKNSNQSDVIRKSNAMSLLF